MQACTAALSGGDLQQREYHTVFPHERMHMCENFHDHQSNGAAILRSPAYKHML